MHLCMGDVEKTEVMTVICICDTHCSPHCLSAVVGLALRRRLKSPECEQPLSPAAWLDR